MKRLLHKTERQPIEGYHELYASCVSLITLPQDKFLVNPTDEEKQIIYLYAAELRKHRKELDDANTCLLTANTKIVEQAKEVARLTDTLELISKLRINLPPL